MAICVMSGWTCTQTRYRPTCFDFWSRPVRRRLRAALPALSPSDPAGSLSSDALSFETAFSLEAAVSERRSGTTGAGLVSPIFGFGRGAARGASGELELLPPDGSGG